MFNTRWSNETTGLRQSLADEIGRKYIGDLYNQFLVRENCIEWLLYAVAFDRMTSLAYPKDIEVKVVTSFLVEDVEIICNKQNVSMTKGLMRAFQHLQTPEAIDALNIENRHGHLELFRKHIKKMSFKFGWGQDLVDSDLISLAITGFSDNKRFMPVCCFTADPIEKMEARIAHTKELIKFCLVTGKVVMKDFGTSIPKIKYGKVYSVNTKGKITHEICVKTLKTLELAT